MTALDDLLSQIPPQDQRPPKDIESLSRYAVKHDRFDMEDFNAVLREQVEVSAARETLVQNVAGEAGYDVAADMCWLLYKVMPEMLTDNEVRPNRLLNKRVLEEAGGLREYERVRRWAMGDWLATALAFEKLEPFLEIIFDRMKEAQRKQEELDEAVREALQRTADAETAQDAYDSYMEMLEARRAAEEAEEDVPVPGDEDGDEGGQGEGEGEPDEQQQSLAQAVTEAQGAAQAADSQAQAAKRDLEAMLAKGAQMMRDQLQQGLDEADKNLETLANMSVAWGSQPGELIRLPAKERVELANRILRGPNAAKFKAAAKVIGPFTRFALAEQKRKVDYLREEVVGLTTGDDLPWVIPEEFGFLMMSELEMLFLANFAEQNLLQFETTGRERVARGGILYIHDGSNSMKGDREKWAKGIGIALLNVARSEKRSFFAMQFGSRGQLRVDDFRDTRNLDPHKVLDFIEYFWNSGTCFETPLLEAMKILEEEHREFGAVRHDIVFATDGEARVSDDVMKRLKELQAKLEVQIWGIAIAAGGSNEVRAATQLKEICDGKVTTIEKLLTCQDAREVFRAV